MKKNQAPSAGYPNIEALLDQDKLDLSGMLKRQEELVAMSKAKNEPEKSKIAAKHAALAYDKFFDIFSSLLEVKKKMYETYASSSDAKTKKPKK